MHTNNIDNAAKFILAKLGKTPELVVVLGSGLGSLMDDVKNKIEINYSEIPGFPQTTVFGHLGMIIAGELGGKFVMAMKGRFHYYEGHHMETVVMPIRVFYEMGIRKLLLTNACGGVNTSFVPGDLMILTDHLGFNCPSPLRGENKEKFGPRFPDMSQVYSKRLIDIAKNAAKKTQIDIKTGVYMFCKGPQFETPAEIRAARTLGADAVGMSTVPEAIVANHMKMETLAISTITNMAAGVLDQPLCHEEVLETGKMVGKKFAALIKEIIIEL
ncbi:MAG: purine-nucleoside phosphorylase [Clostridia bacterium]